MSDLVRETGSVEDIHGRRLAVGTDHDAVTIWNFMLSPAQQEEFAQLFAAACHEAKANAEAMRAQAREEALAHAEAVREEAHGPHECRFPCNPPGGTFWNPGPCTTCGKPYAVAQAERQLAEAQAALAEAAARAVTPGAVG